MANDLYLVFATPHDTLDEAEFNDFQDRHNVEVLQTPGFEAARRYALRHKTGQGGFPAAFRYLTMYEVSRPMKELREELAKTADNRERPDWYPSKVTTRSASASSLDGNPDPTSVDHAYFVFTGTPDGMTFDEYTEWNVGHQAVNISVTSLLERGFLFSLDPRDPGDEPMPNFFEAYSLAGPAQQMLDEVHTATGVVHPDNFRHFASFEATALADRKTKA